MLGDGRESKEAMACFGFGDILKRVFHFGVKSLFLLLLFSKETPEETE